MTEITFPSASVTPLSAQRLLKKVVLITGAGGAIGLETSARLLQEGASLALVDINPDALVAAVSKLKPYLRDGESAESRILTLTADVTSEKDTEDFTKKTVEKFGSLDVAFLNAGISYASTSIFDTTEESYDRVMNINVKSGRSLSWILPPLLYLVNTSDFSIPRNQTCRKSHEGPWKWW